MRKETQVTVDNTLTMISGNIIDAARRNVTWLLPERRRFSYSYTFYFFFCFLSRLQLWVGKYSYYRKFIYFPSSFSLFLFFNKASTKINFDGAAFVYEALALTSPPNTYYTSTNALERMKRTTYCVHYVRVWPNDVRGLFFFSFFFIFIARRSLPRFRDYAADRKYKTCRTKRDDDIPSDCY